MRVVFSLTLLVSGSDLYNTQILYFTCSSVSLDNRNRNLYLISDRDGSPNVYVHDLETGSEQRISSNTAGYQKSYVYFDGEEGHGLGKASVCLDAARDIIYYIQDNCIFQASAADGVRMLAKVPEGSRRSGDDLHTCQRRWKPPLRAQHRCACVGL